MRNQRGMTMIGFIFVAFLIIIVALLGMKLVPPYIEFWSVKKVLKAIGNDPQLQNWSQSEIRNSFDRRATIDYITAVKPDDLDITRENGLTVVNVEYEVRVPIVYNISAVIDFSASSK